MRDGQRRREERRTEKGRKARHSKLVQSFNQDHSLRRNWYNATLRAEASHHVTPHKNITAVLIILHTQLLK